jgi:hypothetical protein
VVLGEGKPENQNASVIFCFGEVVQAIDMNQDNYLAEALKVVLVRRFLCVCVRCEDTVVYWSGRPCACEGGCLQLDAPHLVSGVVNKQLCPGTHPACLIRAPPPPQMRNLINEFNPPVHDDLTAAAGAAMAAARRPASGRQLPLVVEGLGGGDSLVRVGEQYLERPW